ncbi:translocation/assembly module TamB domain-containing protein [Sphingomonas sp. MMSM20]|uniref:translocation/assembly module TamB domain-containing protein n=1 Tax=Sphingomonas lycopersici TaxID=2951807 RepID=UPI0022371DF2|nr:translocation/assembly module TamB domain-containing protein [Sphingomonas lycopersici]MCW6529593.1 translocation/assembly module TamB domain-containing protein [Sphingomonas lycopersici]
MADEAKTVVARPLWVRLLRGLAVALAGLAVLVLAVLFGIDTDPGRRFVADQIGNYRTAAGLNITVGRIDGSIYDKMVLSDVRVSDPKGVFLTSPRIDVDWRPFAFIRNHIDVRSLESGLVTMRRNPQFTPQPAEPNAPYLPDIDIDIGKLRVERFVTEPPVAGVRHVGRIVGSAHIADRRAQIDVDAVALRAPGVSGGDALKLHLDAVPDDNRLAIDLKLRAPAGGVVAGLIGTKEPLVATVGGKGSWKSWTGKALATLGGGQLADLGVTARDGHIEVRGYTKPGLYLAGPVERLTAPKLDVAIDTTLAQRKADTRIKLTSDALAIDSGGIVDLANNSFGNFAVDAKLLTPGAIAPNMRGHDVLARLVLNGPFARPTVDYKLRATTLGFAGTTVENVYAEGQARVDANRILIPVHARARRVSGLNPAVGGLANNARIDGDIAITWPSVMSDNMRIRSDNVDATALFAANIKTGRYTGAFNGRVNNYRVESIGIINLTTDAHLVPATRGGFGIAGKVVARTSRIFNSGVESFLGGNAVMRADVGYSPEGIVTFANLRVNAPQFRVTRGGGRYDPANGKLALTADASSRQYGPITARMSGTAADPVILIHAPRPGVGVGLADLDARIVGRGDAYAVTAKGGTTYGPFTADVLVRTGRQLAVDVRKVVFAGVDITGRLVQTAAGPFAGQLQFAGSGLSGNARLAAEGKYQRADIDARAHAAKIPGSVDFTIGRAIATASIVLYDQPKVLADVQIGDMRYGPTVIESARAKINYTGGRGTAQALLTGSNGVPFRVAANARLAPGDWLVALSGNANGVGFKTGSPAHITSAHGRYDLAPTLITFDKGRARISGSYGDKLVARMQLDALDLSIADAFVPDIGIGGQATGTVEISQAGSGAVPDVDARLKIAGFTRSSLVTVSEPVDVELIGHLSGAGGEARALVKRGPTTVGRMVATLRPLPAGEGTWMERLMQAPLGGGIRYNGPAGVLFSFGGLANQQLSGAIAVAADFGGRLAAPQLNGLVRADNLTYDNETYGTRLTQIQLRGRFTADRFQLDSLQARAGEGTVQARGFASLSAEQHYPMNVTVTLDRANLAKSDALGATASGTLNITNGPGGGLIKADIVVPNARYQIVRQGAAEVPELTGVRRKGDIRVARPTDRPVETPIGLFKLDMRLRADNQLYLSGMGLESEWQMDMRVTGTTAAPIVTGGLDLVRGTYSFAGTRFDVTRGRIRFQGGALLDPDIDIQATTTKNSTTFNIDIAGTGQKPQINFSSTPTLPQDEVLSRLLFGTNPENLSAIEAVQLAAALNSLRGSGGGINPLGKLRSATGFDRLRVLGADQATGRGTALAAGKYLTRNIYIEIVTDARGFTATQLTVAITKSLSVLTQVGSFGGSNASVRYSKDY